MQSDYAIIWKNFIELLKLTVSSVSINSWFKDLTFYSIEDSNDGVKPIKLITLETPSSFIRDSLVKRYNDTIEEAMEKILGIRCEIKIVIPDELKKNEQVELPKIKEEERPVEKVETIEQPREYVQNSYVEEFDGNLIEKYTFENFIIGESWTG